VELTDARVISETIRQWILLIILTTFAITLFISLLTIYKNYRRLFNSDGLIMSMLLIRVVLFLIYEFIYPTDFFMFMFDWLHLIILILIFNLFSKNLMAQKEGFL